MIRYEMNLDSVNLAEFPCLNSPTGLLNRCVRTIGHRQHQVSVFLLGQPNEFGEGGGIGARRLFGEDVATRIQASPAAT